MTTSLPLPQPQRPYAHLTREQLENELRGAKMMQAALQVRLSTAEDRLAKLVAAWKVMQEIAMEEER